MAAYKIAVVPGDGIGKEVVPIGLAAARRALEVTGSPPLATTELDWSCERYLRQGSLMPADGLARLAEHDAILFGAVGSPQVPDHVSLWGLLLPIRQHFDLYVNLRPVRVLDGILSPLRHGTRETVDMLFIRENTEGEYSGVGGRFHQGSPDEVALQTAVYSRRGVERIARYAFERARERRKKVASVTKSNAIQYTAVLWDEVVRDVAESFPDVEMTSYLVDAPGVAGRCRREQPLRRYPDRPWGCAPRFAWAGRLCEPQPIQEVSLPLRAGPRIGAGDRRARDREPHGDGVGGRAPARTPRRARCQRAHLAGS